MDLNQLLKNCHLIGITRPTSKKHAKAKLQLPFNSRIVQNFILVWLDPRIHHVNNTNFHNSITELRRVVNTINPFIDVDQCVDFLTDIKDEKILMIISDELGQNVVPLLHDIIQINSIYIFCKNEIQHKQWIKQWPKVKDIFTTIPSIAQALKQDTQKCDQDSISISFVSATDGKLNKNMDQLDPTFMYTQILKEILLTIDFNDKHIKDFTSYYRESFSDNVVQLNNIDEFEKDYRKHCPIWWYTHEYCFYSVLNRALRMMEVDTLIKMGFFIRDLHKQIEQLYVEQLSKGHQLKSFIIYRGQGLSKTDFTKLSNTQGGLISFNNFLSTSKDPHVALKFARSSLVNSESVGIVFVMKIDPSIRSTPFASINEVSYHETEEEILFSMHTIFRVDTMIQNEDDPRLWQVDLIQTKDNDPQLNELTKRIRNEIERSTGWDRLGKLLIKLGEFKKAEELYEVLLDQTHNDQEKIQFYHQLGWSQRNQKKYDEAIESYGKSLEIKQKIRSPNQHSVGVSLNEIGSVYEKMEEYPLALSYYTQGLQIQLNTSSSDQSGLASTYSNIGSVHEKMDQYSEALSYHEKAVEIRQKLPRSKRNTLAFSYNKIGSVYEKLKKYSEAISSHEKAVEIQKNILGPNHPDLAQSYSSIGYVYGKMCQYPEAHQFHQYAVDIGQRSLPANHPRLQQWEKNLEYAKGKCN